MVPVKRCGGVLCECVVVMCGRIAEAFGKDNVKYVAEELKAQGHTKASVSLAKFQLHHFQARCRVAHATLSLAAAH